MDIRNWQLDKILRLPDWCFGRRWVVAEALLLDPAEVNYVISQDALPEVCIIWEVWGQNSSPSWGTGSVEFRMGHQLPANLAEFRLLKPLFGPVGEVGNIRSAFVLGSMGFYRLDKIRQNTETGAAKLVMRMENRATSGGIMQAGIVISSVPREVPDWMNSGQGKNL